MTSEKLHEASAHLVVTISLYVAFVQDADDHTLASFVRDETRDAVRRLEGTGRTTEEGK